MRLFIVSISLLLAACSSPSGESKPPQPTKGPPIQPKKNIEAVSSGEAYALRLSPGSLSFCDSAGARAIDLNTGLESPNKTACPAKVEANTACSGLTGDPEVRSLPNQPNDIVDLKGNSYPLKGKVQDCVADGAMLAIATNSTVVWIDPTSSAPREVHSTGSDRVALGSGWIAWTQAGRISATPIR